MVGVTAAFAIALTWSALSIWLGPRIGLVDAPTPNPLKVHERATPLLGGVGIFLGLHFGLYVEGAFEPGLFAATSIILVLGLMDDRSGLSAKLRLAVEVIASIVLVATTDINEGSVPMMVISVVAVVVAINAVNLFDGLDGLVGSVAVVSALGLGWAGLSDVGSETLGFVLTAALVGFLVLNWQPAKVFLGDNGAYLIGMVLAYGTLIGGGGNLGTTVILSIGTLGVFLTDLMITIVRRAKNGTPIFEGDRSHIYDQLRDRGLSVRTVALIAATAQVVLTVGAVVIIT
jgi:UDP-GlcNAc:undecaprenyl-phosphate GlcNAc-1-phosphate transferase